MSRTSVVISDRSVITTNRGNRIVKLRFFRHGFQLEFQNMTLEDSSAKHLVYGKNKVIRLKHMWFHIVNYNGNCSFFYANATYKTPRDVRDDYF